MMVRLALLLALVAPAVAFVPSISRSSSMQLDAMNRRDAMGHAFAGLVAGVALPQAASASNPALETFKGRKQTKVQ